MSQPDLAVMAAPAAPPPTRGQVVGAIATRLAAEDFGTGPRAALRRLDLRGELTEPALHRLLAQHVPEAWLTGEGLRAWALLIHALALAAPDNLLGSEGLGTALQAAGFAEIRFVNVLDATSDELLDRVPRAVRFLVAKGQSLNGFQLADLIFSRHSADERWAERVRQRIASDYYRAERRAAQPAEAPPA